MATKTAPAAQPEATDAREEGPDAPLLDTLGAELKKLVQKGKERGYVTYDELNAALPPDEVSSEQIEDTMAMLSEAGVNVIEAEEQEEAPAATPAEPAKTAVVAAEATGEDEELGRTDDRVAVHQHLREHVMEQSVHGACATATGAIPWRREVPTVSRCSSPATASRASATG